MDVKRPLIAALLALVIHSAPAASWTTDYAAAVEAAKQQDRAVFVFFTGSDWCGWCMKLDREILSTPEFSSFAEANLILVKVDFPRQKLSAEQSARNDELGRQFGVRGYPTVFVLDRNGKRAGQLGYMEGGPSAFIGAMRQYPGITWRGPAASVAAGSAPPEKRAAEPSTPPPLFNGAPLRPPKRFDHLQLNGILGTKQRPMIIVNNQTLTPGESARVQIADQRVKVTCKEIRPKSAILVVEGNPAPQELFLEGN